MRCACPTDAAWNAVTGRCGLCGRPYRIIVPVGLERALSSLPSTRPIPPATRARPVEEADLASTEPGIPEVDEDTG